MDMTASGPAPAPPSTRKALAAPASVLRGGARLRAGNGHYTLCTAGTELLHSGRPEGPLAGFAADPGRAEIVMGSSNIVRWYASNNLPTVSCRASAGSCCRLPAHSHMARGYNVSSAGIVSAGAVLAAAAARFGLDAMVNTRTRMGRLAMAGLRGAIGRDASPLAPIGDGQSARINRSGMSNAGFAGVRRAHERAAAGGGSAMDRPRAAAPLRGRRGGSSRVARAGVAGRRSRVRAGGAAASGVRRE